MSASEILEKRYEKALIQPGHLTDEQALRVKTVVEHAETQKAVLAALITSLTKKLDSPTQDIRNHKVELPNGYSGRVYDTRYITPFIRGKFPHLAMRSGSGWLTRSIEQLHAFTLDFPGRIANPKVKKAFLEILHDVQENEADPEAYLVSLLHFLIQLHQREQNSQYLLKNSTITVQQIIKMLHAHFDFNYHVAGTARLPVLAIYSVYEILMTENGRYLDKVLAPLKSHTTSDTKSRGLGDIEILNNDGSFYEIVEIKHKIPIDLSIVEIAFEKIAPYAVERCYLLTTAEPNVRKPEEIDGFIQKIHLTHGCEIIVNGIIPTLKYYLRLLETPISFFQKYEENLQTDYDIKKIHLTKWEQIKETFFPPIS